MRIRMWNGVLVAAFVAMPVSALGQCGMMSGGGHQHDQKSSKDVDEKAKRNAKKLLDDPRGRDALMEAILEDAVFTRLLVERLSNAPEWRALLMEHLDTEPEIQGREAADRDTPATPSVSAPPAQSVYQCPMHPDVVSDRPGECLKCGMNLERVPAERADE